MSISKSCISILFICCLIIVINGCNYLDLVGEKYLDDSPKKSCVLMGEIKKQGRTFRPVLVVAFFKTILR